jgi:V/A-type H+-transporting ATPase subunit K
VTKKKYWLWLINGFFIFFPAMGWAQESMAAGALSPEAAKWGFMAAAIAVGASSLGAGIAVALVGSAAMGAMSEKPEMAGRALIFLGLAEGIAIYGLIVAIMILGKI